MSAFSDYYTKELTQDLVWREAEMAVLKKSLTLTTPGTTQEQSLLRANLALIYAHYEGFCKFALNTYIDALKRLKLRRRDLSWNIAAYSMKSFFASLQTKKSQTEFFSALLDEFNVEISKLAEYELPPEIANLWPDLLITWLKRLDLGYSVIDSHQAVLHALVDNRNKIAHGKKLTISSRADLDQYFQVATSAMHEVAIEVCEALEKRTYQRSSHVFTVLEHATPI
jgi:hypothetical protein